MSSPSPAGDVPGQDFARALGAEWAGSSVERPPEPVDAVIIFAPPGALVPIALAAVAKGGTVVCAGIHMSEIPGFSYDLLWGERSICSVADLTRADGEEFLALAPRVPVHTEVETFPLEAANEALARLGWGAVNAPSCSRSRRWRRGAASRGPMRRPAHAPLADPNWPNGVHHRGESGRSLAQSIPVSWMVSVQVTVCGSSDAAPPSPGLP